MNYSFHNTSMDHSVRPLHVYGVLCSILLILAYTPYSFAQTVINESTLSDEYILDQWTVEDGLPVNSVQDILQSSDGYLWLATHDGLVRFDGLDFKVFTSTEYPQLKSNRIHFLEEAADGSILIKTQGVHISRLKDDVITHLISLDISISGNGNNSRFYKDDYGDVWVGGDDGIYVYREGYLQKALSELVNIQVSNVEYVSGDEIWFTSKEELDLFRIKGDTLEKIMTRAANTLAFDLDVLNNEFWISSNTGLFRFSNEQIDTLLAEYDLNLTGVKVYSTSEIYLSDYNKGYLKVEGGEIISLPYIYDTTYRLSFNSKHVNGFIWNITSAGIYKAGEIILENPDLHLFNFEIDRENNIWVGTNNDGLLRLRPKLFKTYSEQQGLPERSTYTIFQSMDSTIWVGTFGGGIANINDGVVETGFTIRYEVNGLIVDERDKGHIQSLAETKNGTLLVSSLGAGLQELNRINKTTRDFTGNSELGYHPYSLFYDSEGYLWAGFDPYASKGLVRFKDGEWEQISGKENVPLALIRNILETPSGELWFATLGDGLIRYDGTQYYNYDVSDGLSSNVVRGLHITKEEEGSVLWVGFEDMGLDRISLNNGAPDFDSITNYQTRNGLFDNSIHTILEDEDDRFWINTNRGIFRVDRSELNAFHRGDIESINSRGYTEQDGLLSREGNGGVYPSGVRAFDGYIWFPTQDGVVSFHPDSIVSNDFIPPVTIQEVRLADGKPSFLDDEITLKAGERDLEISYASLSFTDSEKNEYRYILEGYDEVWRNVGTRRTAYYTNLPSGTYTFRVQGSNNEGVWNTEGASFAVVVAPYFYETPLFYVLVVFFSSAVILLIIRLRTQYFKRREEILKNEVALRTKELEEKGLKIESQAKKLLEMDEVKSRFFTNITHEFRTPLTLIIGPLERLFQDGVKPGNNQHRMMLRNSKHLLHLIDQLLDVTKLETKSVPINPEPVLIKPYLRKCVSLFTDGIEAKGIGFTFTSSTISSEVYIDPEKIEKVLGNLLSNALKFTPPGGQISVQLEETDSAFLIKINDTGVGISEEELPHVFNRFFRASRTVEEGFGIGLSIAKELIGLHKGSIEVESKPKEGTTFTIYLLKGKSHFDFEVEITDTPDKDVLSELSPLVVNDFLDKEVEEEAPLPLTHQEDKTTILVVDDNADMRSYIGSILSENYHVLEAKHGAEALDMVEETSPDVIVADIMMPEMDGTTLNRKLKESILGASIPFVFLTAKTDAQTRISGINEGADFYLTKPFDANELKAIVSNLLSVRERVKRKLLKELNIPEVLADGDEQSQDPFIQKFHEVLEQEYSNYELTVDMLQEKMYMSRSGLYRAVLEKTGKSTQKYVLEFRLKKARHMFLLGKGRISEVAYTCGFNSVSYFGRVFKEYFGESPSEFLKDLHKT